MRKLTWMKKQKKLKNLKLKKPPMKIPLRKNKNRTYDYGSVNDIHI